MQPTISICIPNYNGASFIHDTISSIYTQNSLPDVEILIHDDASTDNSVELLHTSYPEISLLKSDSNVGFCISCNRLAAAARGEYILLLNNDATLMPDALSTLLSAARAGNSAIYSLPQYDMETGALLEKGFQLDLFMNPIMKQDASLPSAMLGGSLVFLKKSLWEELGGFPAYFGSMAEDMLLCCKARLAGHELCCVDKSGYLHWVGRTFAGGKVKNNSLYFSPIRRRLSERNKTYVMLICHPLPILILLLPLHLLLLLVEGCIMALIKKNFRLLSDIYLNVYKSIFENRSVLMRDRKTIQGKRVISTSMFFKPFSPLPHKLGLLLKYGIPKNL